MKTRYSNVGVVGAGVMGTGMSHNLAQTNHRVVLVDISTDILNRARDEVARHLKLAILLNKELCAEDEVAVFDRIEFTTDYDRLRDVDFVVENTTERWPVKKEVLSRLDRICGATCIFAANTSIFPISRLADATTRPDRVIGTHFMNPVFQKPVVEVIRGNRTTDSTMQATMELLAQMGKRAVVVKDVPGFVSNRVLMLTINEAILVVQEEVASPRDVDEIFVKCFAHRMGPLKTADLIGLDTVLFSLEALHDSYEEPKYRPAGLLRQMVEAGRCGRKSGHGFFDYAGQGRD